jgi:oxygen-dependent protoporphyrinogen oxidase
VARKPWAAELCRDLGLEVRAPAARGTWLWTPQGLVSYPTDTAFGIPGDPGQVFRWPGLSRAGRRRALRDLLIRARRSDDDEALGALLRRRLGNDATDGALAPLLTSMSASEVDDLSVQASFPELQAWERSQGSLIRGAQAAMRDASRRSDPGPLFIAPVGGVERLVEALAASLSGQVRTEAAVNRLAPDGPAWRIEVGDGEEILVSAVVLAVGARSAATLLSPVAPDAADVASDIPAASTGSVLLVYGDGSAASLPEGVGFVVPRKVSPMTSCTWLSAKWPREEYGTRAVLRCAVGAAGVEDVLDGDDSEIVAACERHLAALLALPDHAEHTAVVRWRRSMPQYRVGHVRRIAQLRERLPAGIFVAGQGFDGVGVTACVRSADGAAEAAAAYLGTDRPSDPEADR